MPIHPPEFALIFDLDGTLVDSLHDITDALNHALRALELRAADAQEVRAWIGDGLPTLCRRAAPNLDDAGRARLVAAASARYLEHCVDRTRPYPNILKTLDLLQTRGVPSAVLSNKPDAMTQRVVDALRLRPYFAAVRGCVRESDKKPSPTVALQLASAMNREPTRLFVVGDSPVDVETARNAGMGAIGVTWGFRDEAELRDAGPDRIIGSPLELPDVLDG